MLHIMQPEYRNTVFKLIAVQWVCAMYAFKYHRMVIFLEPLQQR